MKSNPRLRSITCIPIAIDFCTKIEILPYVRLNIEKLCSTHIENSVCDLAVEKSAGILEVLLEVEK